MKAIIKRVGENPEPIEIDNTLEALQAAVGGYIEPVTFAPDAVVICDEEGRIKGKPKNCTIWDADFVGDLLFVGVKGDEFTDLPISFGAFRFMFAHLFKKEANA